MYKFRLKTLLFMAYRKYYFQLCLTKLKYFDIISVQVKYS